MEWDAFLPHVLPFADQCTDSLALDHVVKAAREFCLRTKVWNFECEPVPSIAGQASYVVQLNDGEELVQVHSLFVGRCEYAVSSGPRARRAARSGCGERSARMSFGTREFVLNPAPGADDLPIVLDVAVAPLLTAAEWPDDLGEYLTDIAHGAVASLTRLPGQPWRDMATSQIEHDLFQGRIETVRYDVERGHSRAARPHRGSFF